MSTETPADREPRRESKPVNPYLNARREWNDHVGRVVNAARAWQITGIVSLLIAACSVVGLVVIAQRSQFVPYVIEVDKLGQVAAVAPASTVNEFNLPAVTKAMLATFINRARMVTPDGILQEKAIRGVYAHLATADPAKIKMNQWYQNPDTNPFKRSKKFLVSTDITAIIAQSADSWQVNWTEVVTSRQGEPISTTNMQALVTVYLVPPTSRTTEKEMQVNPIGLYVKDFNWSKIGL